jgi:UDP-N-acetylglucosamine--N-acetylmuramyl-(pentapeptide) pyrophosphoryl-undecaprenol N-acetylglucosamine transferase
MMGDGPIVRRAAEEAGIPFSTIIAPKLRRYTSASNVLDIFKIPIALAQSLWKLLVYMPDAVFAKGGYTCAFPVWVARLYRIPVYLHESDSVPGLANRMLAKKSVMVFTSFASADNYFSKLGRPTLLVGNPFRAELCCVDRALAHTALKLDASKKTIFITGSSLGAKQLNDVVLNALVQLVQKGFQVIHQTGERNFDEVKKAVELAMSEGKDSYAPLIAAQYRVYPFLDQGQLATAYGAADIAVTRASAGMLTELSFLGKPMIIVPLPGSANDHQLVNAAELGRLGAVVMDGANVSAQVLMLQIDRLLDPVAYADVSSRIRQFAKPDAAQRIAQTILRG